MIGCGQNRHHRWDVWCHTLEVVRWAPADPGLRWAALLHDAGKPGARILGTDGEVGFHGHEARSLEIAAIILERLKAAHALRREVLALVRHHGTHPTAEWSDAACRRFLRRLGEDGLELARWGAFRLADQRAKGLEVEAREREHAAILARLESVIAAAPPLAVKALALDGAALMALAGREGGPWLGKLQRDLLEVVIEDPSLNTPEALAELAEQRLSS